MQYAPTKQRSGSSIRKTTLLAKEASPPHKTRMGVEYAVSLALLFLGSFGVGATTWSGLQAPPPAAPKAAPLLDTSSERTLPRSSPVRLEIPAIGVSSDIIQLSANSDGSLGAPDDDTKVGWYEKSPTPGELGPSILTGHVDNYLGPAVFFNLKNLKPGHEISVARADGSVAAFKVYKLSEFAQDDFPTAQVYGNIDHAGLRLITCSGAYNPFTAQYSHNVVVYASLREPEKTTE